MGNMSSLFGGFNFHQVRSKKSVATAVSTRDSQGGVRNWLETRSVGNSHGNGWRCQAGEIPKVGGYMLIYVCFLKWWYPQIIQFSRVFHYKPSILGYHHFRKPPYIYICIYIYICTVHGLSWLDGRARCCYLSGDNGYCVIKDQGTTWGTIEYSSSLEFLLAALYSCNIPVKFQHLIAVSSGEKRSIWYTCEAITSDSLIW